jgi:hypothetical protein
MPERVFIEHGTTNIPFVIKEPLEIEAARLSSLK